MKRCTFKGSIEEMKAFVNGFPSLFCNNATIGLHVKTSGSKNKFELVLAKDSSTYSLLSMPGYNTITVPALDRIIAKVCPLTMLRACEFITLSSVISIFNLDEDEVYKAVFKAIKTRLSSSSRFFDYDTRSTGAFWFKACKLDLYRDHSNAMTTKKFSSIYELALTIDQAS